MSTNCIFDSSVGNNSFLNYLHQQELHARRIFKYSPKPIHKGNNFSFEINNNIQRKRPHRHKSQTSSLSNFTSNMNKTELENEKLQILKNFNPSLNLKNLSIEKKLGNSHSNAMLVRDTHNKLYVMKIINNESKNMLKQFYDILEHSRHNAFLVDILNIFFQGNSIYIITEYMSRGELNKMLTHHLSEQNCKTLLAELLIGLSLLHSEFKGFYKLLSPENIFFDKENHIKIGNFGFFVPFNPFSLNIPVSPFCRTGSCGKIENDEDEKSFAANCKFSDFSRNKKNLQFSKDFIHDIGYYPPEIFAGREIDEKCDSWVIGIWVYEIITGRTLVKIENLKDFEEYLDESQEIAIPINLLSIECEDLLKKIIKKKRKERLSIEEIKNHEFLKEIDWEKIVKKKEIGPNLSSAKKGHHKSEIFMKIKN